VGILKPVSKTAKFTFVTLPLSVFGWQLNKRLFFWIRSLWTRSVSPACPECDSGILQCQRDAEPMFAQGDARRLYPWVCDHCGYAMLESLDVKRVRDVSGRLRAERARASFSELEIQEREKFAGRHKIASRIFFTVTALLLARSIYMLATGLPVILSLNWASFAFMFFVFGMKRSYRAWQMMTGHIFETGAVLYWLRHGKWLI
jgi:hypothetical protein